MHNYSNIMQHGRNMEEVRIDTEFIKLDSFLKWCGAVSLGGEAKMCILDNMVKVNNEICTQRGKKLRDGDIVSFQGINYKVIQRQMSLFQLCDIIKWVFIDVYKKANVN